MKEREPAGHKRIQDEHWVVRIFLGGGTISVVSLSEPEVTKDNDGKVTNIRMTDVGDDAASDTIEYLKFESIDAVVWRRHPKQAS